MTFYVKVSSQNLSLPLQSALFLEALVFGYNDRALPPRMPMPSIQTSRGSVEISAQNLTAVLGATFVAYVWTLHFGFVYDDLGQIVGNPLIQSWRFLPDYFRGNVWMQQSAVGNYFRPLFLTWLLLNHTFFALHPMFWHMTNVAAHLGATA